MRSLLLIGLAVVAACDDRVVLELTGDVPGASHVEVILLEPRVVMTEQRRSRTELDAFTVPYVAQRSSTEFALDGDLVDGLRLEVQDADRAYLPLVIVRGAAGELAIGTHDLEALFDQPPGDRPLTGVQPKSDVTIYQIRMHAVTPANPLLRFDCGGQPAGFIWKFEDGRQLRVVVPRSDVANPLDLRDLDCDEHGAGVPDCDDVSGDLNRGEQERCNGIDDDCNPKTTLGLETCLLCDLNPPNAPCICDDRPDVESPSCPLMGSVCHVPAVPSGGGKRPCTSTAELTLQGCEAGCTLVVERSPKGMEVRLNEKGLGEEVEITAQNRKLTLEVSARENFDPEENRDSQSDPLLISMKTRSFDRVFAIALEWDSEDVCDGKMTCFTGPPPPPAR